MVHCLSENGMKEITRFTLCRILKEFLPIYPVYLLLFQQNGLSLAQISFLMGIWCIPGLLFELPSSVMADLGNRRNLMGAGLLIKMACFATWALYPGFIGYAVGFLLWGTGSALYSGTAEAWLYDSLKESDQADRFDKILGRSDAGASVATAVAFAIGPIFARMDEALPAWLSAGVMFCAAILAFSLPERNLYCRNEGTAWLEEAWRTILSGFRLCAGHKTVRLLLLLQITLLTVPEVLDEYDQLIAISMGVPFLAVGLWGTIRFVLLAAGETLAWRIRRFLSFAMPDNKVNDILVTAAIGAALLLTAVLLPGPILLPAYGLFYFLLSSSRVLYGDSLQKSIDEEGRATVQSLSNLLVTPSAMAMFAVVGLAGSGGGTFSENLLIPVRYFAIGMLVVSALAARMARNLSPALCRLPKDPPPA